MSIARPTFGTFKKTSDAGDYIYRKKALNSTCNPNVVSCCSRLNKTRNNSQNELMMLNNAKLYNRRDGFAFSVKDLNINLVTTLDLLGVSVILDTSGNVCPTQLEYSALQDFYIRYAIDPKGELFGNTPCGQNNYQHYLRMNLPSGYK